MSGHTRKAAPDFMRPMQPDQVLAAIVGDAPMPRTEVTKKVWEYIKRHQLQDPKERRFINADEKLRAVFDGKPRLSMFEMTHKVNAHLRPVDTGEAPEEKPARRKRVAKKNGTKPPAEAVQPREPAAQIEIRVGDVKPYPQLNTRTYFDETELRALADSIARQGMLQPLVLHEDKAGNRYVIAGERRYRAALLHGPDTLVPATVRSYTDAELVEVMLVENLHRRDLRPIEEARGFMKALELDGMTQRKLAERVNRSQPYISNAIRLLELPESLLNLIDAGELAPSIARDALLPFMAVPEQYRTLFFEAVATELTTPIEDDEDDLDFDEGETVRDVIHDVALKQSRSLQFGGYGHDVPVFSPQRHAKGCDCGGPEIDIGGWQGKVKRCWNVEWWDAEQKRAKADKRKRENRAAETLQAGGGITSKETFGGLPVIDDQTFVKALGHNRYGEPQRYVEVSHDGTFRSAWDGENHVPCVFDLDAVDRSSLVLVSYWGGRRLVVTDIDGYTEARQAFEEQAQAAIAERRSTQIQQDLFYAGAEPLPQLDLLRFALKRDHSYELAGLATELGFIGEDDEFDGDKLRDDQLRILLDVAARRDDERVLLAEDVIRAQVAEPFAEKLRNLIPWESMPRDDDESDDLEDDDEEAEELAAAAS